MAETIYALSSGPPPAAIAVIRVSGAKAGHAVTILAGAIPPPRYASLRTLRGAAGDVLDQALVLFFPGPDSATGEDVAEFHVHGGSAVIRVVLGALAALGLRLAGAGEFTRRAVLNDRLSLNDAEGLADLLAAETETARREALLRASGHLTRQLETWVDAVVDLCALVEAAIDHDEEVSSNSVAAIQVGAAALRRAISQALARPPAERLRDGVRVAIVGAPNVGKSSLFNALLASDAAIVSPVAGTTRDVIERPVALGGIPFILCDTAGIRDTSDPIERIGVERARVARRSADLILNLDGDQHQALNVIAVTTKADLGPARRDALAVSSVTRAGIADLIERLCQEASRLLPLPGEVALGERQRRGLADVTAHLDEVLSSQDIVVVAEELRRCRTVLDRLVGRGDMDAVYDRLFSRFCLGK